MKNKGRKSSRSPQKKTPRSTGKRRAPPNVTDRSCKKRLFCGTKETPPRPSEDVDVAAASEPGPDNDSTVSSPDLRNGEAQKHVSLHDEDTGNSVGDDVGIRTQVESAPDPSQHSLRDGAVSSGCGTVRPNDGNDAQGNMASLTGRVVDMEKRFSGMERGIMDITSVLTTVRDTVEALRNAPSMVAVANGVEVQQSKGSRTVTRPKVKYDQIMSLRVPHLRVAFHPEVLSRCMMACSCQTIVEMSMDGILSPASFHDFLAAALFSVKKGESKEVFRAGTTGKMASAFRKRILVNCLSHSRRDTFHQFSDTAQREGESSVRRSSNGEGNAAASATPKPVWLGRVSGTRGQHYIPDGVVVSIQEKNENPSGDRTAYTQRLRIATGAPPSRADDGDFAMSFLYTALLKHFHSIRRNAPQEFFQLVGYLFSNWHEYNTCTVKKNSLRMSWAATFTSAEICPVYDIPDAVTFSDDPIHAATRNEEIYNTFARSRKELHLVVEHDVLVRLKGRDNALRNHVGEEARRWKRMVSLLDVAGFFIRSLCGFQAGGRLHDVLSFNRKSIATLYAVANVFRQVVAFRNDPVVRTPMRNGGTCDDVIYDEEELAAACEESLDEHDVLCMIYKMLTPAHSLAERALHRATCAIPEELYNGEHIDDSAVRDNAGASNNAAAVDSGNTSEEGLDDGSVDGSEVVDI